MLCCLIALSVLLFKLIYVTCTCILHSVPCQCLVAVDDVAALQAAADQLSPDIIRKRLDYWTFILGPKFSAKERKQVKLSRIYAITQVKTATTSYSNATFQFTSCSSEAANSASGG